MICGTVGRYHSHLRHLEQVVGLGDGVDKMSSLNVLLLPQGQMVFICDTQVAEDPSPQEIANMTMLAADQVRRFGNNSLDRCHVVSIVGVENSLIQAG
jgi:malate dehydrogenase (oxaloacetate-decarboxylating)(NADP+)